MLSGLILAIVLVTPFCSCVVEGLPAIAQGFNGRNCSTLLSCYKAADDFHTSCTAGASSQLTAICVRHTKAMKLHCEALCSINSDNRQCDSCLDALEEASDECARFHRSFAKDNAGGGDYPTSCRHVRLYFFQHCTQVCRDFLGGTTVPEPVPTQPDGTRQNPARTGKDLADNPKITTTGLYWIQPRGETAPAQTCVDLKFDGGGWALASYGFVGGGGSTKAIPNMNHPGGYDWTPSSRGNKNGLINLTNGAIFLARAAKHMLMAGGYTGSNGCNINSYGFVYKISIEHVKKITNITFANHNPFRGGREMIVHPFIVQALKGETGSPNRVEVRYALSESLGTTWPDSYPTMYGFSPSKDGGISQSYDSGPAFPSVISGDGHQRGGGKRFPPDVIHGHEEYTHRGWYSLDGTGRAGHITIWFR